jgi:hypothetical protein
MSVTSEIYLRPVVEEENMSRGYRGYEYPYVRYDEEMSRNKI